MTPKTELALGAVVMLVAFGAIGAYMFHPPGPDPSAPPLQHLHPMFPPFLPIRAVLPAGVTTGGHATLPPPRVVPIPPPRGPASAPPPPAPTTTP